MCAARASVSGVVAVAASRLRIGVVIGTRPEAIKLAPVIRELTLRADRFDPVVVTTSQHSEMTAQVFTAFDLGPHLDLGLTAANQGLAEFTAHALLALAKTFRALDPDLVLVQGDTSTVVAATLAALYEGIAVGHVEAGLRSGDLGQPFPEEANRRLAACAASLHFAPTEGARQNLLREGVSPRDIYVTGNTAIDALSSVAPRERFEDEALNRLAWAGRSVLLATVHRRENLGPNLRAICAALRQLAAQEEGVEIVVPVHQNPGVREVVRAELADCPRILLLAPLSYPDLLEVLRRCRFVLTDSGGIQEEAPSFGKPVLVLREVTERPEVIEAGFGQLVGSDPDTILGAALRLLHDEGEYRARSLGQTPFGDGRASQRIAEILLERLAPRSTPAAGGPR